MQNFTSTHFVRLLHDARGRPVPLRIVFIQLTSRKRLMPHTELRHIVNLANSLERAMEEREAAQLTAELTSSIASPAKENDLDWESQYGYGGWLGKRAFDSLGGYDVHSFKRSAPLLQNAQDIEQAELGVEDGMMGSILSMERQGRQKRILDSLGMFQVHGWKRSPRPVGRHRVRAQLSHGPSWIVSSEKSMAPVGDFELPYMGTDVENGQRSLRRRRRSVADEDKATKPPGTLVMGSSEQKDDHLNESVLLDAPHKAELDNFLANKRFLDRLGGAQVHGWKRALDSLGGHQIHGWKRALDSLGGFQLHGAKRNMDISEGNNKRGLDSLGGFQIHGMKRQGEKRALDSLGSFQVHGLKRQDLSFDDQKRALDSLGSFQVHGLKRNGIVSENEKRALDSLGGFQIHGMKRDNDKRSLDSLGSFQLHGMKRENDKKSLDSLGSFQLHGMKRENDKKSLDSLGSFQLHGMKRENDKKSLDSLGSFQLHGMKRALDSLGDFQVHGMKRDKADSEKEKRGLDSLGGFQVHGMKRGLDSLGGFQVHGMKRGLDSLGGFQVHGMKRGLDSLGGFQVHGMKRGLDSLGGFQVHGMKRGLDSLGGFQVYGATPIDFVVVGSPSS
ncbi:feeding circuit activating peptides [Plakobranchus ocellatus]|uniref:Feeding circuit activating peptides n=1 Tax=Plakobranchus ocellatus TaxID=259542 RepID=A0AAV4BAQ0_9GAST|nr:feeding circuit activating peptides [Plakobranchus ocellatus]